MLIPDDQRPVYSLKSTPAVLSSYDEAMERAQTLKPILREGVAETERLRRLPAENVADLLESGLYGLMTARRFGGSELGPETMIDVSIELASACPSSGWVHMLWTAHMWMLAQFPLETQSEIWSNPNMLASSVVNTVGDVVPVDGGFRWTGRGFFSSGVDHCGGSGLFESSDLQRLWRDVNAAAAHNALTLDWIAAAWTRTAFGLPTDPASSSNLPPISQPPSEHCVCPLLA